MVAKKIIYPIMPVSQWWKLREQFKKSIPGVVTANYIASVLNMKQNSARTNILPYLINTGIINKDGKPTERANRWRNDGDYKKVCEEIKKEIYPQELLDACPDPVNNKEVAERWFASKTKAGANAISKMTAFYSMLCEADVEKARTHKKIINTKRSTPSKKHFNSVKKIQKKGVSSLDNISNDTVSSNLIDLRINLQIHISSDASPDQIDQIFKSIAKYIYQKESLNE
ncbi:MAG: DUF5343 domain-containing protein [Candidatus Heimdallarchaeaceae archaeon]